MRTLCAMFLLVFLSLFIGQAAAQEAEARKRADVDYYVALFTKFKPGAWAEARQIIYSHFWPTDHQIGHEVIPFDVLTGEWDHVVFFRMEGGPGDLAWQRSPTDVKWDAALARKLGGEEAMQTVMKRFQSLIDREHTVIVARPRSPE